MSNYGYSFNLSQKDKNNLETYINFSNKNDVDFWFNPINFKDLRKELKRIGFKIELEEEQQKETEIVYSNKDKKIFFYINKGIDFK